MSSNQFQPLFHFNQIVEQAQADGTFSNENIRAYWEEADSRSEEARWQHEKLALARRMETVEKFHSLLASIKNAAEIGEPEFETAIGDLAEFCGRATNSTRRTRQYSNGSNQSTDTYSTGRPIPRLRKLFDADEGVATVAFVRITENGQLYLGDRSNKRNIWVNGDWSDFDNTVIPKMSIVRNGEWVELPSKRDEFDVAWKRSGRNILFVRVLDT